MFASNTFCRIVNPGQRHPTFKRLCRLFSATNRNFSDSLIPILTKDRYPNLKRGKYTVINDSHIKYFKDLLDESRVIIDEQECIAYNTDWNKTGRGYSSCVLKPKTAKEVSRILAFCNDNSIAVCPQGGNTGLVGGSVPIFDEVVLSTSLMNNIISLDEISGTLVCDAGCILETLDGYLSQHSLIMPLDLGAKGSCQIGGNVSTNAGGLRLMRYGSLQGSVLGLEAVKANGKIIDCLSTLKKDNTGYHLKHLFIGSEGSLGVVTKVAIQCAPKPKSVHLAFLGVESFKIILNVFKRAKHELGEILSSFEMIDADAIAVCTDNLKLKSPLKQYPFYILIETHGSSDSHDSEKLSNFLESLLGDGTILDGTMASEPSKMKAIWELRERITEGLLHDGYGFKYDMSVPLEHFYSLVEIMRKRVGVDTVRVCGYGHIGDGNVHLNITAKEFSYDLLNKIEPFVYEYTSKFNGSISAEHGIGFRKTKYMHHSKNPAVIEEMRSIKMLMDPKGILNPYKVLPPT